MPATFWHDYLDVRILVDGELAVTDRIRLDTEPDIPAAHRAMCDRVHDEGREWVVEITDPDGLVPPIRFSNQPDSLTNPIDTPREALMDVITNQYFGSAQAWDDDYAG